MNGSKLFAAVAATTLWLGSCAEGPTPPPPAAPVVPEGRVAPPFAGLRTTDVVVEMIKDQEGLRLESYRGPAGEWLIGYGHGGDDVTAGRRITSAEADALLREDLKVIEDAIKAVVTVPINADELSAMVDLAYNIGTSAFRTSTVLRELNAGNRAAAADAFLMWDKMTVNGQRVASPVLAERRRKERAIFLGQSPESLVAAGS